VAIAVDNRGVANDKMRGGLEHWRLWLKEYGSGQQCKYLRHGFYLYIIAGGTVSEPPPFDTML
jgi:hypothetical protein